MRALALLSSVLAVPLSVSAHHSLAFYGDEVIEVAGELVDVHWRNPHIRFTVRTPNPAGSPEIWEMESNSVYHLRRGGVTADRLEIGQQVVVVGRAAAQPGVRAVLASHVLLADGEQLVLSDVVRRFTDDERPVDAAAENKGIFRVWSMPAGGAVVGQVLRQSFTESAIAARASWDSLDNFTTRCEPEGMPRIMANPHPFEFVDRGRQILLRTELYDIERRIHMDRAAPPEEAPWSPLGYSVGAWEEGALVVRTTRINWPYFDTRGTPQSEDVQVSERFLLSEDQTRLSFEVTVTDPATLREPAVIRGHWLALGETLPRYDCQPLQILY